MVDSLNLSNYSVDDNGRVIFSGVGSGINFADAVDNIIAARRIPIDRLEAKVELNGDRVAAFSELRGMLNSLKTQLNNLRGRVTFGGVGDIFKSKDIFASTTAVSGTASPATNLLGVSVTNAAAAGSHTLEILQVAASHKIGSDTATSKTSNLGLALGGVSNSIHGAFEINGRRIIVEPTDTLIDLADRINTANTGGNASGVTASIVSAGTNQHVLVLTSDKTGEDIQILKSHRVASGAATSTSDDLGTAFGGGAGTIAGAFEINGVQIDAESSDTLQGLADKINAAGAGVTASILASGGTYQLVLTADDATQQITIDKSHRVATDAATSTTDDLGTALGLGAGNVSGSFELNGIQIDVLTTDTLESLRDKINAAGTGATAKIIDNGGGSYQLAITSDDAAQQVAVGAETNNVLADLGISLDGGTSFQNVLSDTQDVLADLAISNDGGGTLLNVLSDTNDVLADLGISADGGATFQNVLKASAKAKLKADGLIDAAAYQSAAVATATTAYNVAGTLAIKLPDSSNHNVVVDVTDTPTTLRDTINADPTLQAAGISASLVTQNDGTVKLEIRKSALTTDDPGSVLSQKLADPAVTQIGVTDNLTFSFTGGQIAQIAVAATDTLNDIRDNINNDVDLQAAGVSAQVVADGANYKLVVQHDSKLTVSGATGLGMAKPELIIERDSNTISDVLTGITLTLFQAEVGTTVKLDVEQNLSQVKSAVVNFVDAYNAIKVFINAQGLVDPATGQKSADAGPLFGNSALSTVEQNLARILGLGAQNITDGLRVLAEVGIIFTDNNSLEDPTFADTLEIDETVLDEALLNKPEEFRRLFAFDFTASDPRVALLSFTGQSKSVSGGYTLDVTMSNGVITGATINGVAGSTTISGNVITATNATGANGLKLVYNGTTSASNIQLDFSAGIGSEMYFEIDRLLDTKTGALEVEVGNLTQQSDLTETRITDMLERLEYQREKMMERFAALEAALASMNTVLESIRQQVEMFTRDN